VKKASCDGLMDTPEISGSLFDFADPSSNDSHEDFEGIEQDDGDEQGIIDDILVVRRVTHGLKM
jgi:hypothetical protein